MKEDDKRESGNAMVAVLLGVLVVVVVVQSYYLFRMYRQQHPAVVGGTGALALPGWDARAFVRDMEEDWPQWDFALSDPIKGLQRLQRRMDGAFGDEFKRLRRTAPTNATEAAFARIPRMDMTEKDDEYVLQLDLPGMEKQDITVNVEGQVLTVAGETTSKTERKDEGRDILVERSTGSFKRVVTMPTPVDADKMTAVYKDGLLTVTVPKSKEETSRKSVPVQ